MIRTEQHTREALVSTERVNGPLVATHAGTFEDGTPWQVRVPVEWNRTLLLYSHGPIYPLGSPPWPDDIPIVEALLRRGYAVAGCGSFRFWPLEENVPHQMDLLGICDSLLGPPEKRICWGESIGGLMTAAIVQRHGERFDGAMPSCGPLAGGVATQNHELDCTFVFKHLLAPESDLQLVHIKNPRGNLDLAHQILAEAQRTPEGRARLAFAASVMNIPSWIDPTIDEPSDDDLDGRQEQQVQWLSRVNLMVFTMARAWIEERAGGNPSWTLGVDYGEILEQCINRQLVVGLYDRAGASLAEDIRALAKAPRIEADIEATRYMEKHIVFDGDLRCPVLTLETKGDGLCTPDHMHAYRDVVQWAGNGEQLRQLYINRGGHCSYTPAEVLVALEQLERRIETGTWEAFTPDALNSAAGALGPEVNRLSPALGALDLDRHGIEASPRFFRYAPQPFTRPYDVRDVNV